MIAPFFLWGTAMVVMKSTLPQTTPFFMAGIRLVPAGLLVLLVGFWLGRPQPKGWMAWLWITLFALIDGTLFQGFLAAGLVKTGAGLGSVMIDSQPLMVALLALWLFGERVGLWGWLGLTVGIIGISLIGLPDEWILSFGKGSWPSSGFTNMPSSDHLQRLFTSGQGLMLLAAFAMAIGTVMIRKVCRHADPIMATGWHMILGGIPLLVSSYLWESQQWVHLELNNWLSLGYATVFGSAIAYGLFFYFAAQSNLTSFSALTFLTPVFALAFGNLFLAETLNALQWAGVCLTLGSIYLVNQRQQLSNRFTLRQRLEPAAVIKAEEIETTPVAFSNPESFS